MRSEPLNIRQPVSVLTAIGLLIRLRWQILRNDFWRRSIGHRIGLVVVAIVLLGGIVAIHGTVSAVLSALTSPRAASVLARLARDLPAATYLADPLPLIQALPTFALTVALLGLLLSSFSGVLASLYLSRDLDLLLVAPVPRRALLLAKIGEGMVSSYLVAFAVLSSALLAYGRALELHPAFHLTALLVLLLLPLTPLSLALVLVMSVVRLLPARRARAIVGVIGALMGLLWFAVSQFAGRVTAGLAGGLLAAIDRLNSLPLPSTLAGQALLAAGKADWPTLILTGGGFTLLSLASLTVSILVAERLYRPDWAGEEATEPRRRQTATRGAQVAPGRTSMLWRLLTPPIAAIVMKDLRVVPRDLRHLGELIFPIGVAVVAAIQLATGSVPLTGRGAASETAFIGIGPAGISFFLAVAVSGALAGPGITREGRHFWLLRVAPISTWRLLAGKLIVAYLPFALIGGLVTLAFVALGQTTVPEALLSLSWVLLTGLGTTSIGLGLGAAFPRFDWENSNQQATRRAGCLTRLINPLYVSLSIGLTVGVTVLARAAPTLAHQLMIAGWLGSVLLTAAVSWGALTFGASQLNRLDL